MCSPPLPFVVTRRTSRRPRPRSFVADQTSTTSGSPGRPLHSDDVAAPSVHAAFVGPGPIPHPPALPPLPFLPRSRVLDLSPERGVFSTIRELNAPPSFRQAPSPRAAPVAPTDKFDPERRPLTPGATPPNLPFIRSNDRRAHTRRSSHRAARTRGRCLDARSG